ncbi:helix-turn-helix transcriptional regulator [Streptomyces synnematoformans]|uniref:HTH cro/C1-type domain-containing protein n=1 Tax=Streptomyces synnematoformans TaxID=415721 RepID=A0ABP5IXI2_9ACTN
MPAPPDDDTLAYRQAVGARIRELRIHAKLTQWTLGDLAGADHKTIHRIEYGVTDPPFSLLIRIAWALDVDLADLLRT